MFINNQTVYDWPAFSFSTEFVGAAPAGDFDAMDARAMDDFWCVWCAA